MGDGEAEVQPGGTGSPPPQSSSLGVLPAELGSAVGAGEVPALALSLPPRPTRGWCLLKVG